MANYNNAYGTRTESKPRYSRNSKMDLEARRRSQESRNEVVRSNVTPMSYNKSAGSRADSAVRPVARTTTSRNGSVRPIHYGNPNTMMPYGSQRSNVSYGRNTAPISGVRKGETGINSRKATTMGNTQSMAQVYQEGNTMRYAQEAPLRRKQAERNTQQNRKPARRKKKVRSINKRYTMFLTCVTISVAGMLMSFLNVQSNVNTKASLIATLQKNIADLSVENDSAYGAISQNMNMESVKDRAEEMGMEYADGAQVIEYEAPMEDTVKQYETIPTSGVLAQSERTSE